MSQIASLVDYREVGPPGDIGLYQRSEDIIVFPFTFSGTTYYCAIRSGSRGWVLATPTSTNPLTVINAVIGLAQVVVITRATYSVAGSLTPAAGVTIIIEGGTVFAQLTDNTTTLNILGLIGAHLTNINIICLGYVKIDCKTTATEDAVIVRYSDYVNIFGPLEVEDAGREGLVLSRITYCIFERINVTNFGEDGCWCYDEGQHNHFITCLFDGENKAGSDNGFLMEGDVGDGWVNNEIRGCIFARSHMNNGLYLSAATAPCQNNYIVDCEAYGIVLTGHAGLKLNPASWNTILNFVSHDNVTGIIVDDGGTPPSSIGNHVEAILYNNSSGGLDIVATHTGGIVRLNKFVLKIYGNGGAVSTGIYMVGRVDANLDFNFFDVHVTNTGTGIYIEGYADDNTFIGEVYANVTRGIYIITTTNNRNRFPPSMMKVVANATNVIDNAADTAWPVLVFPFSHGNDPQDNGWQVQAAAGYARTWLRLPPCVETVIRFKVYALSKVAEADRMLVDIDRLFGGADNEPWNTHNGSIASLQSTSINFAASDIIFWTVTTAGALALTGGDSVELKVLYRAAVAPDCATSAYFRTVEVEYV